MRKLFFMLMAAVTLFVSQPVCNAEDVWVDNWDLINSDIYVKNDTIIMGPNDENISFRVEAKEVRGDTLANVVICDFVRWPDEPWRFRTSESDNIDYPPVVKNYHVFEYCMRQLGLNYSYDNGLYY